MTFQAFKGVVNTITLVATKSGFYLEKYFWGGSILQCNKYNRLLQKYTLCRGSGGVSPRKVS